MGNLVLVRNSKSGTIKEQELAAKLGGGALEVHCGTQQCVLYSL